MGISRDRSANYNCDEAGTALNFEVLEAAMSHSENSTEGKLEIWRNNRHDMISFVPGFGCDHGGVK